jgi:hypothetical protein
LLKKCTRCIFFVTFADFFTIFGEGMSMATTKYRSCFQRAFAKACVAGILLVFNQQKGENYGLV